MTRTEANRKATIYLRKIRNPHKRDYGYCYLEFLLQGATGPIPYHGPTLSLMGAQSVRMTLDQLFLEA